VKKLENQDIENWTKIKSCSVVLAKLSEKCANSVKQKKQKPVIIPFKKSKKGSKSLHMSIESNPIIKSLFQEEDFKSLACGLRTGKSKEVEKKFQKYSVLKSFDNDAGICKSEINDLGHEDSNENTQENTQAHFRANTKILKSNPILKSLDLEALDEVIKSEANDSTVEKSTNNQENIQDHAGEDQISKFMDLEASDNIIKSEASEVDLVIKFDIDESTF